MNFGGPSKPKQNLTLAERQAQLEAEKKKKEEEKRKQTEAQFGNAQQWDSLGSRAFTPSPSLAPPVAPNGAVNDDDDLFAAFNKDTKVDKSSHYPPPDSYRSTPVEEKKQLDLGNPSAWGASTATNKGTNGGGFDDDDDPFGLNELKPSGKPVGSTQAPAGDDDDFLGDLARPVEEVRKKQQQQRPEPGKPIEDDESSSSDDERFTSKQQRREGKGNVGVNKEFDGAVAQLMDYGFSAEDARRGLTESGAGLNVQAAANWLLDDAHKKSKAKAQGRSSSTSSGRMAREAEHHPGGPSGRSGDTDLAKSAAAVGSSLFKTANSLWKTGQKKMQKAVADFQQEGRDQSQPKWMRDAHSGRDRDARRPDHNATDEAMALESGGRPKPTRTNSRPAVDPRMGLQQSRTSSPAAPSSGSQSRNSPVPRWQQTSSPAVSDGRSRLNRIKNDDDDDTFFVSANRRKKSTPTPSEPRKQQEPEPDLLFNTEAPRPSQPIPQRPAQRQTPSFMEQSRATPPTSRKATPKPPRQVPPISPAAMQASTKHRLEGTAHFKRGDYDKAHSSYSNSITTIPATHPLLIILLTNRALTAIKTGDTKQAVSDADEALKLIGTGNGQGESVAVQGESGKEETRDMRDLYGKALSRKAEALEQMEKWADALAVWTQCVEAGVGGPTAIKGRQRCQNAVAPKPKAQPKPTAKPRPKPSATASLAPQKSSEAVTRLREANEAAAREDDEKFALADKIDAKISAWRDGKRDNLRGLLSSLDQVLWEGSGWKKVGLHELVMANKVKISYMKAIAKTHPDKVSFKRNQQKYGPERSVANSRKT